MSANTDETPLFSDQETNLKSPIEGMGGMHMHRLGSTASNASTGIVPPLICQEVDCGLPVGKVKVYIQRPEGHQGIFVMNVPDLGSTYHVVQRFYQHSSMSEFSRKSTWIHVIPPGQDLNDEDLPSTYQYPTFQQLGEALVKVLDHLQIKHCLLFGEGAGANILSRFALKFPDRVDGLVLIHCIGSASSFWSSIRERLTAPKLSTMSPSAEAFFVAYHFGKNGGDSVCFPEVREAMQDFQEHLHHEMNPKNMRQYVNAHLKRSDLQDQISNIKSRCMFVVGDNYQSEAAMEFYQSAMMKSTDKSLFDLIKVDGISNVLEAAQEKVADSLLLFVQGIGLLSSVLGRSRSTSVRMGRSASMQEADSPAGYYRNERRNTFSRQATGESESGEAPDQEATAASDVKVEEAGEKEEKNE